MYETVAGRSPARSQLIHVVHVVHVVHLIRVIENILYESFQRFHHSLSFIGVNNSHASNFRYIGTGLD